jgi:trk system potassium uptake protein TrkH
MNLFAVAHLIGLLVIFLGAFMLLPVAWAFYYHEPTWLPLLLAAGITAGGGGLLYFVGSLRPQQIFRKEGLAVVGTGWLVAAAFGALPFVITGTIPHYVDAYFETMSGFTTTGSTILTDIEALPRSVLFWRSLTHWLGGMGIIVLFIAILPILGAGGRHLYKSEVPGLVREALTPKIKETAMILWKIYLLFTVAETILLMLGGMNLFEALCHTFGTLATGGFSTRNASIAAFKSVYIDAVIIFFMFLAGTNFSLHFGALRGKLKGYLKSTEWRAYAGILVGVVIFLTLCLWLKGVYGSPFTALRYASFQGVSIMTTTGFCTADFNVWPESARAILVIIMFIGGCAGSTGGGMKVIRFVTIIKVIIHQIERVFRPRRVKKIRIDETRVDKDLQIASLTFFCISVIVFVSGTFFVSLFDIDLITSATSVAATLNNIGPGLERVGAIENYAHHPYAVKALLSLFMVMGRLELFSILVLFMPRFWKS